MAEVGELLSSVLTAAARTAGELRKQAETSYPDEATGLCSAAYALERFADLVEEEWHQWQT